MAITNVITLNQIIKWFQLFQQNNYFLNDFGFGEPYDIGTSRQMNFPYMWVMMNEDNTIGQAAHNKTAIPELSFSIMFMDKINIQENYLDVNGFPSDNSQEILSDMLQVLQDLLTDVAQNWQQYGVFISQDVTFYPAVDETTDKATGVVARIVLKLKQVNCIIPENPYFVLVTFPCSRKDCIGRTSALCFLPENIHRSVIDGEDSGCLEGWEPGNSFQLARQGMRAHIMM